MSNKLYVGNLAYSVRDEHLQQAFSRFGTVTSAKVMMDRETGRSKGFGFVEMAADVEAQAAVDGMNGQPLDGRAVIVNHARPRESTTEPKDRVRRERERRPLGVTEPHTLAQGAARRNGVLPFALIRPLSVVVSPGSAKVSELSELFLELSVLYQMVGGSGINFYYENSSERVEVEA